MPPTSKWDTSIPSSTSEIHLRTDHYIPRKLKVPRPQPACTKIHVVYLNIAPVHDVEDVHVGLDAGPIEPKTLRKADIELLRVVGIQRAGLDQRHGDCSRRAARQVAPESGKDLGIRCHVACGDFRSGNDLEHAAYLDAPQRYRINAEDLDIRLERRRDVAVQQCLWRIHHETGVRRRSADVHSAIEHGSIGKSLARGEIESIVDLGPLAKGPRPDHLADHLPGLRLDDIIKPAYLVPATVRQTRIHRRRDTERIKILWCHAQIVGHLKIA